MCRLFSQFVSGSLMIAVALTGMSASVGAVVEVPEGDALFEASMETPRALEGVFLGAARGGAGMFLVGERGHIVYSEDDGESWQQAVVPVRSTLTSIFFLNDESGWAVGHDTVIIATEDGGRSWVKQLDGYQATELVLSAAEARMERLQALDPAAQEADRELYQLQLEFAEIALDEANRDLEIGPAKALMDIWFGDASNGLATGANGYLLRTGDGGASWEDWSDRVGNPELLHLYKLVGAGNGVVYLVGEMGMAYRSSDLGASWEMLELPYEGSLFGGLVRTSDSSVYLYGLSGVVLRSQDEGESWVTVPTNSRSILQNAALDDEERVIVVGLGGVVLRENEDKTAFEPMPLAGSSALTGVMSGNNGRLVIAGEAGVQIFDKPSEAMQRSQSLRFMFHKR